MKQLILGTFLGKLAMASRDTIDRVKGAVTKSESLGTIINDQIATHLVTQLCDHNKTFIDVGAHIGSIIALVSDYDASIKVIAVEAIPDKARKLRRKFPGVEVHNYAVGNREGEVYFYINTRESGYSSLRQPSEDKKSISVEIKVPIASLDSLVSSDDIDVIKIDVEGAELEVLRGSETIITKNFPVIMFESAPSQEDDWKSTKADIVSWLNDYGYEVFVPNRVAHNGPGLSQECFIDSHYYPRRTTNYFAIPIQRLTEIRDRARTILDLSIG
ncbi:FkbM family methyltransferase [Moorena sp. SIO3H5]|uniref:FkbM family methyltransferase n=1 Tax=Moorena sp. SIO3H5 TaxID=2607834 RepID=UPI0025D8365F|nr:FkbM family methyltransferase [Moorena sp. SIO3H5]